MLEKDLFLRNPLRFLDQTGEEILAAGAFGAVHSRAGVGKTALVVQIALDTLLRHKKVMHVSLNEPVGKVNLWYQEVFERLGQYYQVPQIEQLWDTIAVHRFIMTLRVEGFSVPKLEERLTDLTAQHIFTPNLLIIDGLPFDNKVQDTLSELKILSHRHEVPVWLTVTTHRHEAPADDGLPIQLSPVKDLFDVAIALQPVEDKVHIQALKSKDASLTLTPLMLDPATMLIQKQRSGS